MVAERDYSRDSEGFYSLRLFVTGSTSRSQQAIQNLSQICEEYLQGRYKLEVIDVSKDPAQARQHQILAVPTLLKELPPPLRKIVGDLSEKEKVLEGLDIYPQGLK
ncbi:MAG: circadian clock KaiB family protein [Desulfohalobiaceae bacterium]